MARPVDTIWAGSFWGYFGLAAVVNDSLRTQAEDKRVSNIRAISEMKRAAGIVLFAENDPKMTPLAKMTPDRDSGVDINT